ncbi:hypothetical protein M9Y10_007122 [Tritrichomonas musculus]|uniref:Protein kinase domain-containing protein n=1 Tax=Tritrichomonas musculus TaxID=1915356 RepID=A0ABR2J1B7_9EUKA
MCYRIDENKRFCLSFKFHNFYSFSAEEISNIGNEELFYISCKYDYVDLLEILQGKTGVINVQKAFKKGKNNQDVLQFLLDNEIIGIDKFAKCKKVRQITIPSFVTSIEECAFKSCSSLKKITILSSITSIKRDTFSGCSSLREIVIPSSVTSIERNAFKKCSSLVTITIPCSITTIEEGTFNGCSSLKEIKIPSSVIKIKSSAFFNCSSLEEVTIPSFVRTIEYSLFGGCSSLKHITLPESINKIESFAFAGCSSLEKISLPSSVSNIDSYAFYLCSSLTEIKIPPKVTCIQTGTFGGCVSLEKVIFHDSFESIEVYAFYGCFLFDPSSIPSTVEVNKNAFDACFKLKKQLPDRCPIQLRNKIFKLDDYEIGRNIGRNYNYNIYKAKEKNTGKEIVIKSSQNVIGIFIEYALSNIGIPGILKINWYSDQILAKMNSLGNKEWKYPFMIIKDYMKNGSLDNATNDYLRRNGNGTPNMNPTVRSKIIFGIACIMKKVHKLGIIHQNLTMDNILLDDNFEPLINCFGPTIFHSDLELVNHPRKVTIFVSPEIINKEEITTKSDVYSYAIILYLMFSRTPIFKNTKRMGVPSFIDHILNGRRFERPKRMPDYYWNLIERCWHQIPEERPTFEEITNILKNDIYALEEFGMKTDLQELHEYQNRMDKE